MVTPLWVVTASLWHGPARFRVLEVRWHRSMLGTLAVQWLVSILAFAHSTGATNTHTHTHRLRIAKSESTAKSSYSPWENKHTLWPNTHTRAAKTNLDHSVAKGICSTVPLSRESQRLALYLSGKIQGGRGSRGKKSWTIKYYTVFNTSFSIPADSILCQC